MTVLYGSRTKLRHLLTGCSLHSHALFYGHGGSSGQQQVTAFAGADDNDFWFIKGSDGHQHNYQAGQPARHDDIIRLQHVPTGRNLHSHPGYPSPITRQQEATCFGEHGTGDGNDNWRVEIEGGGAWEDNKRIRLIHVNTNHALHSHGGYSHPEWTAGQQEVTCSGGRDDNDWWAAFENAPLRGDMFPNGSLLREVSRPEVYITLDGVKVHIPTPSALRVMGHDSWQVQIVADGVLAPLREFRFASSSPTPGSLVFPPDHQKWHPIDVAGTQRVFSRGKEVRVVELRGWLRALDGGPPVNQEEWGGDWHYGLEVDPLWADQVGIDLNLILKVGNIAIDSTHPESAPKRRVAAPLINVELNAIGEDYARANFGPGEPQDWIDVQDAWGRPVRFPFNPLHPPNSVPLQVGAYVRMVGSLVHDAPHVSEDFSGHLAVFFGFGDPDERARAERASWGGLWKEEDPAHPARWTEMHPPDLIQVLPEPAWRRETLRGVAVIANNGLVGEETSLDTDIFGPDPRPSPSHRVAYRELVGAETNFRTIVEGNPQRNGAAVAVLADHIHVHVKVKGQDGWGAPGKFKAIYRVWWEEGPPPPRPMQVQVAPYPVPLDEAVSVVVRATAVGTGAAIAGEVFINGQRVGQTGTPFIYTFRMRRVGRPPNAEYVAPTGQVRASGYVSTPIDFGIQD